MHFLLYTSRNTAEAHHACNYYAAIKDIDNHDIDLQIGFYNLQRVEQDSAVVSVGIRIDPDHRQQGIATAMKKTALDIVSKQGPSVKTRLQQSLSTDHLENLLASPANTEKILRRYVSL